MPVIRPIDLEWRLQRREPGPGLWGLLLLGVLGVAVLVQANSHLDKRLRRSEVDLERAMARSLATSPRRAKSEASRTPAELRQLRGQIALLNRDWSTLLGELVPGEHQVKLLGMEANAVTGVIRVIGRASGREEANVYAEALQVNGQSLQDVRLLLLERKADGIQFEVSARWPE